MQVHALIMEQGEAETDAKLCVDEGLDQILEGCAECHGSGCNYCKDAEEDATIVEDAEYVCMF